MSDSLKATERARRQKGAEPVCYRILGNYNTKVPTLKKLLSHTENKDDLTVLFYLVNLVNLVNLGYLVKP